jgi:proline iminopeptidase
VPLPIPAPHADGVTTTTDVPLYWCRHGHAGAPPLLVLHGGPGAHHDYLLPQLLSLADLGDGYDLVFYDQRGGGRSKTDDPAPITVQQHVADCAAVQRELGIAGAPIVGYSWGALLALHVAIAARQAPATIPLPAWLALISPAPYLPDDRATFEAALRERSMAPAVAAERAALQASGLRDADPDAYRHRAFELSVAGYFDDIAKARNLTPFRVTGRVQTSTWASVDGPAVLAALPSIELPAVVIHGRNDPIPVDSAARTATALGVQVKIIDQCGHVPYVEAPAALDAHLRAFIATLP